MLRRAQTAKKMRKRVAHEQALWYEEELQKEITKDRETHGKKPLKEKDKNAPPSCGGGNDDSKEEIPEGVKTQKCSTTVLESGWFRKGEHKLVFAYAVETACDKHGWILGYSVHPGNEHDSRPFMTLIALYSCPILDISTSPRALMPYPPPYKDEGDKRGKCSLHAKVWKNVPAIAGAFPVFQDQQGQRYHEPLDWKVVQRLKESVSTYGIQAAFTRGN